MTFLGDFPMLRRSLFFALLCFSTTLSHAQTVKYGSAAVALGGNQWGGIPVPNGLWTGDILVFDHMTQQANILPSWVDVWNINGPGIGLQDGQDVSWRVDLPTPGGAIRCSYKGTVKIYRWLYMYTQVYISYSCTYTTVYYSSLSSW